MTHGGAVPKAQGESRRGGISPLSSFKTKDRGLTPPVRHNPDDFLIEIDHLEARD